MGLLITSTTTLLFVLTNIIKNKMNIRYAMIWVMWSVGMVIISIHPKLIYIISDILHIQVPVNTVFLMTIFLLYCLSFYVYLKISKHNEEILKLNYEISILKKEFETLKKKGIYKDDKNEN